MDVKMLFITKILVYGLPKMIQEMIIAKVLPTCPVFVIMFAPFFNTQCVMMLVMMMVCDTVTANKGCDGFVGAFHTVFN